MGIVDNDSDPFGELLSTFRKRARLTQRQLGNAIGRSRQAISRWELGDVLPGNKAVVLELARRLHLNEQETQQFLEASLTAPVPIWGVPFSRNAFFTGREEVLEILHRYLSGEQSRTFPRVVALSGLGGVGKTQTSLEYAYRHALEYRAIFWIEAESLEHVSVSLQRIAELLQLPERTTTEQQHITEAVQRWLATHDQWLLIWDNLEDLELPHRLLPLIRQGALLLTTRQQALGTLAQGIHLLPMGQEESMLLLLGRAKILKQEDVDKQLPYLVLNRPAEYAAATKLVTLLGGLPLALDQAGAYLEETGCSLNDYLNRYQRQRASLLDRRGSSDSEHPQSVAATFRLSQQRAEYYQQGAADLLRICAFLNAEAIPEELFHVGAMYLGPTLAPLANDLTQFDLMLAALRNLSLVQRQTQTHTLSLHRLVQAVLREQMDPTEERLWSIRVVCMVNAAFPEGDFATRVQGERYLAQALACAPLAEFMGKEVPEAGELLSKAGRYLMKQGRPDEAEPLLVQAVVLGEQYYGPDHPALIPRLTNQVELFWKQGKYVFAEALSSRLLEIEEHHLEPTSAHIGETLNNLATLYWEQGYYADAEPLFQRALAIREQALGPEHADVGETLNNFGILQNHRGKYEQAELLLQRALAIRERALGSEHPEVAFSLNNIATLYVDQGKYVQAEPLLQRAISIQKQTLGPEHPDIAFSLNNLAVLYRGQGRYAEAETLFQQALSVREQALGSENPLVASVINNLAILRCQQRKYAEAEMLFQRALHIREQALGSEHLQIARSLRSLADLYTDQGKYGQAETLYGRALQICERRLDPSHLEIARSLVGLANLYEQRGEEERAALLLQRACAIFERHLSQEHFESVRARNKYRTAIERGKEAL